MAGGAWRVWIDTGGTFTDCLALDPEGRLHRAKVLSTSALRGRVRERVDRRTLIVEAPWQLPDGFLAGFTFRPLAPGGTGVEVVGYRAEASRLELAEPVPRELAPGDGFEVASAEEAPILAARVVTGCRPGEPLPAMALRLATTRGTNALLERKGAATALFVTRGFADLLAIGSQQRPHLFDLAIEKPRPLYRWVVEVTERLAADGSVLVPLALEDLAGPVAELVAQGAETAAVALLHSYRNPAHEAELAAFLGAAGIAHVSTSARLAPLIQLLPRAETAVVDAYLAPVIGGYLARVAAALPRGSVEVMTSAGGLVRAAEFSARDSLLSGPAGGVVGAAQAGRRSGFRRLIAFDMGGTSTDVSRWDGDFEYVFEHRVGDARLVAPALAIESVAAGGGSVCWLDGAQLKVGPESAGASPGPACYGAGGPLTLTDVNLLLGRLDPGRFGIPIHPGAAERALADLVAGLEGEGGAAVSPEGILAGFLEIANERMADAIRRISVARGYDPADHALVAFGGAGAQHALAVAGLLGIATVVVPPDAGLLSALGLGAAVVERFAQRQVLAPLDEVEDRIPGWLEELAAEAVAAVCGEGAAREEVAVRRRILDLRFLGQESTLAVEHADQRPVAAAFAEAYLDLYGYRPEGRRIELASMRVVASTQPEEDPPPPAPEPSTAVADGSRRAWFADGWREVPVYHRARLRPGARFAAPALILEAHSATVVEPGWEGRVDGAGSLVLRRE